MVLPSLVAGQLPPGRWTVTARDVEAAFARTGQAHRQQVWADWLLLTEALRDAVSPGALPAAWLSGSFLTDKPEPRDIDCVYVLESSVIQATRSEPQRAAFIEAVATSRVREHFGLLVDSYILRWVPTPGPARNDGAKQYLEDRGYWDDLWTRRRSAVLREDAVPSRGYLEVIIDGYE